MVLIHAYTFSRSDNGDDIHAANRGGIAGYLTIRYNHDTWLTITILSRYSDNRYISRKSYNDTSQYPSCFFLFFAITSSKEEQMIGGATANATLKSIKASFIVSIFDKTDRI